MKTSLTTCLLRPQISKISLLILLIAFFNSCVTVNQKAGSETTDRSPLGVSQGNQYARDGLLREAVESYKSVLQKEPENFLAHRNLGIVLVKSADYQGAISHLEKALNKYDDNFDTNFYLAEAYRAIDNYAEAIFRYKSALKIQPDESRALKSLAWSYYKTRFYTESLNIAQKLSITSPSDDQVPIILARIYLRIKRENDALSLIRKAMTRITPASVPYYLSVEAEILQSKGSLAEALSVYKRALKAQPMLAGALLGSGKILIETGKPLEAIDFLERAVRVKPRLFEAHYFLGRALEANNPQRALRYFAYFRKNASADPELLDLVQDSKKRISLLSNFPGRIDSIPN